jgi:hypothetical protein
VTLLTRSRARHGRADPAPPRRSFEAKVTTALIVFISCAGGILASQAESAGSAAARHNREGVVAALRFHGEVEQAELQARREQRTFLAYVAASLRSEAQASLGADPVAKLDAEAERRFAARLEQAFPEEYRKQPARGGLAAATFDVERRTTDLVAERQARNDSEHFFALAAEKKGRRDALLYAGLVLLLALASVAVGQLTERRPYAMLALGGGWLAVGSAMTIYVLAGR